MKDILFLLPSLKIGGAEKVNIALAKAFLDKGYTVKLLLMNLTGELVNQIPEGIEVVDLKCRRTIFLCFILSAYFFRRPGSVLISNFWKLNVVSCISFAILSLIGVRPRLLLWEHSPPSKTPWSPKWLFAFTSSLAYQIASAVIAVSPGVKDDLLRWSVGLGRLVEWIPNPVPPPDSGTLESYKTDTNKRDCKVVITVARLEQQKNLDLLLKSFAILSKDLNARLILVGSGSLLKALKDQADSLGINQIVEFVGFKCEPYLELVRADLFVLSSNFEGLPTTIIEALHCGLPVVSTDCPSGPAEILQGGLYGSLVPMNDVNAMAAAMKSELDRGRNPQVQRSGAERYLPSKVVVHFEALLNK